MATQEAKVIQTAWPLQLQASHLSQKTMPLQQCTMCCMDLQVTTWLPASEVHAPGIALSLISASRLSIVCGFGNFTVLKGSVADRLRALWTHSETAQQASQAGAAYGL